MVELKAPVITTEVELFLLRLERTTREAGGFNAELPDCGHRASPKFFEGYESKLSPYKANQAWPGRKYELIGNSFNLDSRIIDTISDTRRSACIAVVLTRGEGNRKCLSVEDAFTYKGFLECLSRFEYDWLSKQPPSTLIGPAYDSYGELLPESFAVWRRTL